MPSTASTHATPTEVIAGPRQAAAATKIAVSSETSLPPGSGNVSARAPATTPRKSAAASSSPTGGTRNPRATYTSAAQPMRPVTTRNAV